MSQLTDGTTLELPHELILQHGTSERTRQEWWYLLSEDVYGPFPHKYDERVYCSNSTREECKEWLQKNNYKSKYGEFSGDFTYVRKDASAYKNRLVT